MMKFDTLALSKRLANLCLCCGIANRFDMMDQKIGHLGSIMVTTAIKSTARQINANNFQWPERRWLPTRHCNKLDQFLEVTSPHETDTIHRPAGHMLRLIACTKNQRVILVCKHKFQIK